LRKRRVLNSRICVECKEEFQPKRSHARFCCDECRSDWWRKVREREVGKPTRFRCEEVRQ
jgi:predicted RNA-binding Zn-ribbon protein involved in translation (DUF1610 family)